MVAVSRLICPNELVGKCSRMAVAILALTAPLSWDVTVTTALLGLGFRPDGVVGQHVESTSAVAAISSYPSVDVSVNSLLRMTLH